VSYSKGPEICGQLPEILLEKIKQILVNIIGIRTGDYQVINE